MAVSLFISFVAFAFGLLLASVLVPGVQLKGFVPGLKTAGVLGGVSMGLGWLARVFLTIVFLPIVLLGPLGDLLIQAGVNVAVLVVGPLLLDDLRFDSRKTATSVAVGLAVLQVGLVFLANHWM